MEGVCYNRVVRTVHYHKQYESEGTQMNIKLGEKIREFRKRDGRTQEELATALGVSGQAVSRWEMGTGYPDMELLPSIANYFGVHIDELFGYASDREVKIAEYMEAHDALDREGDRLEEQLDHIRRAVAEFPADERLLIRLAETLLRYGGKKYGMRGYNTSDCDYALNDGEYGAKNEYWQEALTVFRRILAEAKDSAIKERAVSNAVYVMRNMGMYEEAVTLADEQFSLISSREILRTRGSDGEECYRYTGEAIIALVNALCDAVTHNLSCRISLYRSEVRIEKLRGLIRLYELIFDDGNLGFAHDRVTKLYLYLVHLYGMRQKMDDAFDCLRKAKHHAEEYDKAAAAGKCALTAVLVDQVTEGDGCGMESHLADNLPGVWQLTLDKEVYESLKSDPRWDELFPNP